jgi:uncharacterized protein
MPLTFNLRHLEKRDLRLQGELTPEELELKDVDEMIEVLEPVSYDIVLERLSQSVLAQGKLSCVLTCDCVRCLRRFSQRLNLDHWTCDLPLEGEVKVLVTNDSVDLTPYVREDILLAFPQHPLCEPDCPGLRAAEHNLHEPASVEEQATHVSSPWAELNKLKF